MNSAPETNGRILRGENDRLGRDSRPGCSCGWNMSRDGDENAGKAASRGFAKAQHGDRDDQETQTNQFSGE
jgi:hypothetical protein